MPSVKSKASDNWLWRPCWNALMPWCLCELSSPASNLQILHVLLSAVLGIRRNHNCENSPGGCKYVHTIKWILQFCRGSHSCSYGKTFVAGQCKKLFSDLSSCVGGTIFSWCFFMCSTNPHSTFSTIGYLGTTIKCKSGDNGKYIPDNHNVFWSCVPNF